MGKGSYITGRRGGFNHELGTPGADRPDVSVQGTITGDFDPVDVTILLAGGGRYHVRFPDVASTCGTVQRVGMIRQAALGAFMLRYFGLYQCWFCDGTVDAPSKLCHRCRGFGPAQDTVTPSNDHQAARYAGRCA